MCGHNYVYTSNSKKSCDVTSLYNLLSKSTCLPCLPSFITLLYVWLPEGLTRYSVLASRSNVFCKTKAGGTGFPKRFFSFYSTEDLEYTNKHTEKQFSGSVFWKRKMSQAKGSLKHRNTLYIQHSLTIREREAAYFPRKCYLKIKESLDIFFGTTTPISSVSSSRPQILIIR